MDSGYYAAMTGLVARTQALDTAAANLANAQTPGYRAEREYFRSALLGPDASAPSWAARSTITAFLAATSSAWLKEHCNRPVTPSIWQLKVRVSFRSRQRTGFATPAMAAFTVPLVANWLLLQGSRAFLGGKGHYFAPGEISVGSDGVLSAAGGAVATIGIFTFGKGAQLTPEGLTGMSPLPATHPFL